VTPPLEFQKVGTLPPPSTGGGGSGGWSDAYAFALEASVADTMTLADVHSISAEAAYAEANAPLSELLQFGLSGYGEVQPVHTEARSSLATRWATTHNSTGTGPSSAQNAYGEQNGTVATVKAGGLTNGSSLMNLIIQAPMSEITPGSTPTLYAWYANNPGSTGTDSRAVRLTYRQVGQGSDTTVTMSSDLGFVAPGLHALPNIDPAFPVTVTFHHTAGLPSTGGSITVDAVGIQTTGVI
jgi:hypothetical protein